MFMPHLEEADNMNTAAETVLDGANQSSSSAAATTSRPACDWDLSPPEVISNILQYLSNADLKNVRRVNKATGCVATDYLFRALRAPHTLGAFLCRGHFILHKEHLAASVRYVHYTGPGPDGRSSDPSLTLDLHVKLLAKTNLQSLRLDRLSGRELAYLLSKGSMQTAMFAGLKHFELHLHTACAEREQSNIPKAWRSPYESLSSKFPQLESLKINLGSDCHAVTQIIQAPSPMVHEVRIAALTGVYPKLQKLEVCYPVDLNDSFIDFLKRHKSTLKDLYLLDPMIHHDRRSDQLKEKTGLGLVFRFIFLLRQELCLETMRLRGNIYAGGVEEELQKPLVQYIGDQSLLVEPKQPAADKGLRFATEHYICRRGPFPFPELLGYKQQILDRIPVNKGNYIVFQDKPGSSECDTIISDTDDTWYVEGPEEFSRGFTATDFGVDPNEVDEDSDLYYLLG